MATDPFPCDFVLKIEDSSHGFVQWRSRHHVDFVNDECICVFVESSELLDLPAVWIHAVRCCIELIVRPAEHGINCLCIEVRCCIAALPVQAAELARLPCFRCDADAYLCYADSKDMYCTCTGCCTASCFLKAQPSLLATFACRLWKTHLKTCQVSSDCDDYHAQHAYLCLQAPLHFCWQAGLVSTASLRTYITSS